MEGDKLFTSEPYGLRSLLMQINDGTIQLPDFQRKWVWDEVRVQKLLVSVLKNYPIGALMVLETNRKLDFCPITLSNVAIKDVRPKSLLLDGQQRLTSLYQALFYRPDSQNKGKKDVDGRDISEAAYVYNTKKKEVKRYFYININEYLKDYDDIDDDNLVVIVNEDRKANKTVATDAYDYSTRDKEYEADLFPANILFDPDETDAWEDGYTEDGEGVKRGRWRKFERKIGQNLFHYDVPVITLTSQNSKEAICNVFESVNTGGVSLNVFELLTASYAADGFRLKQNWDEIRVKFVSPQSGLGDVLEGVTNVDFLQSLVMYAAYRKQTTIACKRKNILELKSDDYLAYYGDIVEGYVDAAKFLIEECRIFSKGALPYGSQLVPMATVFASLDKKIRLSSKTRKKILRWYWNGVFGEMYGGANETRFVRDFVELVAWIEDDSAPVPSTIEQSSFRADRLNELRRKNSAAYNGVAALLLVNGARDFYTGGPIENIYTYNNRSIDIHHIFPSDYCKSMGLDERDYNSVINKAPLSYDTNRSIGGSAPSVYLGKIDREQTGSETATNEILASQLVDVDSMRTDDFEKFFKTRKEALIKIIEDATEKQIVRSKIPQDEESGEDE